MKHRTPLYVLLAVLLLSVGSAWARGRVKLRIATIIPEGTSVMETLEDINRDVKRRTRRSVQFVFYPGGQQGDESEVLELMMAGQLQGAGFTGMGLGKITSSVRLMEIPFQYKSYEEWDYVRDRLTPILEKEFEEKGYKVLGWGESGFIHVFSKKRLQRASDFKTKDVKAWVWEGDPVAEATFRAFNINPIPLAMVDVLSQLKSGGIDTVYNSFVGCGSLQWYETMSYAAEVPIANALMGLVVSKKAWDELDPRDQKVVEKAFGKHWETIIEETRKENKAWKKKLEEKGITFVQPDRAEAATFEKKGLQVAKELIEEGVYSQERFDQVMGWLEEYRKSKKGK